MEKQYVRIDLPNHPMDGCVGEVFGRDADGLIHVQAVDSSFSGWFLPADVQEVKRGTRVLIEVEISNLYENSMMVAGGWMPLSRIRRIVSSTDDSLSSQQVQ